MTRRRMLLCGMLTGLVLFGVGALLLWPQKPSEITRENAEKIQVGMTLAEVEAILGGPARNESTGPLTADVSTNPDRNDIALFAWKEAVFSCSQTSRTRGFPSSQYWMSDHLMVCVSFDTEGRLTVIDSLPVRRTQQGLLDTLRRWFNW